MADEPELTHEYCQCGQPATRLCDFQMRAPGYRKNCDRPLCDDCAVEKGVWFFCGELGGIDHIDACPSHAKVWAQTGGYVRASKEYMLNNPDGYVEEPDDAE